MGSPDLLCARPPAALASTLPYPSLFWFLVPLAREGDRFLPYALFSKLPEPMLRLAPRPRVGVGTPTHSGVGAFSGRICSIPASCHQEGISPWYPCRILSIGHH